MTNDSGEQYGLLQSSEMLLPGTGKVEELGNNEGLFQLVTRSDNMYQFMW